MRKTRGDSRLDQLPDEQRGALEAWLFEEGVSYKEAVARLQAQFQVTTSLAAIHYWYHRAQARRLQERIVSAAETCETIKGDLQKSAPELAAATIDLVAQHAFEMLTVDQPDPKQVKSFLTVLLKARQQSLDERKVALLEQRAHQAEEAEKVAGSDLSPEEQAKRIREIFAKA
jgi:hypothetical protein